MYEGPCLEQFLRFSSRALSTKLLGDPYTFACSFYTFEPAEEGLVVDFGGRLFIKEKHADHQRVSVSGPHNIHVK